MVKKATKVSKALVSKALLAKARACDEAWEVLEKHGERVLEALSSVDDCELMDALDTFLYSLSSMKVGHFEEAVKRSLKAR